MTTRDFGAELDALREEMNVLRQAIVQPAGAGTDRKPLVRHPIDVGGDVSVLREKDKLGSLFYSGHFRGRDGMFRWAPQERKAGELLGMDGEKAAKVIAALGHKQRLDILTSVLDTPLTGPELVERLHMGTTGQLYHHIKPLLGADLLVQEERGGKYTVPAHRTLPLLLLLAAVSDLLDASDYLDMTEARANAGAFLGDGANGYDPHLLVWALLENSIIEHQAGYCSEAGIFVHEDGSVTVADNGRGIPVRILPQTGKPNAETVMTAIRRPELSAPFYAPGGEKGISAAVVNALSRRLTFEIRRDGSIYRQEYRYGIPQTALLTVGTTSETGTAVTLLPEPELFHPGFDPAVIAKRVSEVAAAYPQLTIRMTGAGLES